MGDLGNSAGSAAVRTGWDERPFTGSRLGELARHPLSGGALNVIGVLAGIFGAIIADDVQQFFLDVSPYREPSKQYSLKAALAFVGASVILLALFALRQWAIDRQRGRDHIRLQGIAERIQSTVRTHPPRPFMSALGIAAEKSFVIARDAKTQEHRELAIRLILKLIADLARTFEGSSSLVVGANLMIFVPRTCDYSRWEEWYREKRFFDGDPADLAGMLVLSPRMSATAGSKDADPDASIINMALPIPKDHGGAPGSGKLWNVLPGAPLAYARRQFEWFCPVSELHAWCSKNCDLREAIRNQLKQYFDRMSFTGFLSTPVFSSSGDFNDRVVSAIVNVHWEGGSRFTVVEAASNFAEAIYPLCIMLSELLKNSELPSVAAPSATTSSAPPSSDPRT
jgi:hypothetical protein